MNVNVALCLLDVLLFATTTLSRLKQFRKKHKGTGETLSFDSKYNICLQSVKSPKIEILK